MKPEVRVKLLKEYETIKMKSERGSVWSNIIFVIFFCGLFIRNILHDTKDISEKNIWGITIICSIILLILFWHIYIIIKKIYDKKILMLLQAVLDLSEEKISNEINKLDLELPEKEK